MSSIHQHGTLRIGDITSFDLILLLIISETTQQALIGDGFLGTQCFLLVTTLAAVDQAAGWAARRWPLSAWLAKGVPLVILKEGRPLRGWMERSGVQESDILMAAREAQGLEQLEQIKYAVLERAGGISILPKHE